MTRLRLAALFSLAAALAATAWAWDRLPGRVPMHFDLHGQVDGTGPRASLFLLPAVMLAAWLFFEVLPRFDPRFAVPKPEQTETERFGALHTAVALALGLLAGLQVLIIAQALGLLAEPPRAHALLLAGFLLLFGNFIGRLRPSWFLGIRTPWTLSSDEVWRRTHRLAGRLMVPGGLLALLLALLLPAERAFQAALVLLIAGLLIPAALSFFFWRKRAM